MKLIFATGNAHKLSEVQQIMGDSVQLVSLKECGITEDIPETEPTIEGNALQKARFVHRITNADCFADDTGLEVDALGGAPGVHSARYATDGHDFEANISLLLSNMEGVSDRKARFRTVVALIIDGKEHLFEGIVNGRILRQPAGNGGFGYDSVFMPDGAELSFAQMPAQQKNAMSHRARAIEKMKKFLEDL